MKTFRRCLILMMSPAFLVGCPGPDSPGPAGVPSGQEYIWEIVFDDDARAWVNREPDPTALLTSVYWQATGEDAELVRLEVASQRGLTLGSEGLYFVDEAALFRWISSERRLITVYEHNGLPTRPILDDTTLYLASTGLIPGPDGTLPHEIRAFPRAGGDPVMLYARADQVIELIVDDGWLYWIEMTQPDGMLSVFRAPSDGTSAPERLYELPYGIIAGPDLYASGERLYWWFQFGAEAISRASILSAPKDGSAAATTLIEDDFVGAGTLYAFEPEGPTLFGIAPESPNEIVRWPLAGAGSMNVARCAEFCVSVASFEGRVMWADADGLHPRM